MENGSSYVFSFNDRDNTFHTLAMAWNVGKKDPQEGKATFRKNVMLRARAQRFVCFSSNQIVEF
jgi:hypothetical protein